MVKEELFRDIVFSALKDDINFKEDSVREEIIMPLLHYLGYGRESIVRSLCLNHPYLKIGSDKKRSIRLVPDYVMKVESSYAWVLDAKGPREDILDEDYIGQVYSYAVHPEIRSNYFALCNGIEFALFRTNGENKPLLYFQLDEIDYYYERMKMLLSPDSFHFGKQIVYKLSQQKEFDSAERRTISAVTKATRSDRY